MSGYDEQPSPDAGGAHLSRHAENDRHLGDTIASAYDESDRKANGLAEVDAHAIGRELKPMADHEGVSVPDGMARLARQHALLRYGDPETKRQTLGQVMDGYGVVPHVAQQMTDYHETNARLSQALDDPYDAQHDHAVELVNQDWAARQVGGYQQQVGQYEQQIDGFARATDGKPAIWRIRTSPRSTTTWSELPRRDRRGGSNPISKPSIARRSSKTPNSTTPKQVRRARQGRGAGFRGPAARIRDIAAGAPATTWTPSSARRWARWRSRPGLARRGCPDCAARPGARGTPRARAFARRRASASPRADSWRRPGRTSSPRRRPG